MSQNPYHAQAVTTLSPAGVDFYPLEGQPFYVLLLALPYNCKDPVLQSKKNDELYPIKYQYKNISLACITTL